MVRTVDIVILVGIFSELRVMQPLVDGLFLALDSVVSTPFVIPLVQNQELFRCFMQSAWNSQQHSTCTTAPCTHVSKLARVAV